MPKKTSLIVGLTGSIATGKSSVAAIFSASGFPVICADEIAHRLTRRDGLAYGKVLRLFGQDFLTADGDLDRQKIAERVFRDAKSKRALEKIIHPLVRDQMLRLIRQFAGSAPLVFLDVPLLFESGLDRLCDATVCVMSSQKNQITRLKKFRGMSRSHALSRIRSQMPLKEKARRADFVIVNNNSKTELKKRTLKVLSELLSRQTKNDREPQRGFSA